MYSIKINSLDELNVAAKELISAFNDDRVFAFYGKMGAGKTTFIQSICRALGSDDNVTSPTFALINEYNTAELDSIFHFDFYRIKDIEEAFDLGYEDYIYSGSYCLIEWPEMIEPLLPEKMVEVKIEVQEDDTRLITAREI
ncbi:tRNA (adenosine(37)-N6)-threonylcarbamoyltransferase complex ATPase subunit type 1 TsaE [uncultured Draconibacterium sp.]|uniref:tRNA (adenosine(37)-N6)-threonylcarbamoyltransferase complex ATPase subunit type 1 TsaE n=1 Tax=uncultured Draconibacterium sp. TaxID=1573823 RepID=UPI0029C9484E|nr:tRNA (adenosine(37)-N6)-threonylcarbamoyltransferase complex ATPase subunit type 1 TsaE [uncultured Draconibacterium sp.]